MVNVESIRDGTVSFDSIITNWQYLNGCNYFIAGDSVYWMNKHAAGSDPANYDYFCRRLDVNSMIDWFLLEGYCANSDLTYGNLRYVRSTEGDGKWRFMMYDTDFSCGLYDDGRATADTDTLSRVIGEYPLFASALKADAFREAFLGALREIGTTDMSYGRACEALDALEDLWTPLIERHFRRFGRGLQAWEEELRIMKAFFEARYDFMIPRAEEILGGM